MEVDALVYAAGSNVPTISESEASSTGGLRCGEQTKCVWCTWEVWTSPVRVRLNQGRQNRVQAYGSSEVVGSPHSSNAACESRRSEVATGGQFVETMHERLLKPSPHGT